MGRVLYGWIWCVAGIAWVLLPSTHANAQTRQFVDLQYEVDPALRDCPSDSEFRALVARKLGYDPHHPGSDVGLAVRFVGSETGISGIIEWRTAARSTVGERHFSSRIGDCRSLSLTMGFVVAVQLQLMAAEPQAEPKPSANASRAPPSDDSIRNAEVDQERGLCRGARGAGAPCSDVHQERTGSQRGGTITAGAGPSVGFGFGPDPTLLGRSWRPDRAVEAKQARAIVLKALERLPLARRAVFIMHDIDQLPMTEIASTLSIYRFTGYSRLRKARQEFAAAVTALSRGGNEP